MYFPQNLSEIKKYRPATLRTGKEWFVEYYVFSPLDGRMVRKKIKVNHIEKVKERRDYANGLIRRLNVELERGWNPFLDDQNSKSYSLLTRSIDDFMKLCKKRNTEGDLRQVTMESYVSKMNILLKYIEANKLQSAYVYQFNKAFVTRFLDYVYNERNRRGRTRDNYLKTIRLFCSFLVERSYLKTNPADDIAVMGSARRGPKNRSMISAEIREQISTYLTSHNKHFLLASEILYFCMIRPREMSYIRIKHINIEKGTIFIPGETAKNWKDGVVTMPKALIALIRELGIMKSDLEDFLFSNDFKPGTRYRRPKQFSNYWSEVVRPALGLSMDMKMYSLKDSGITDMIRHYKDPIIARDQARHYDLSITNIYTPQDTMAANPVIANDERKF